MATTVWQISRGLDPIIQLWPHGGVVFSKTSGDTHWVPEEAGLVLQELSVRTLSQHQLQQRLAILLEMSEDDADIFKIVNVACEVLSKAALISPANNPRD